MKCKNILVVPDAIKQSVSSADTFDALMHLQGKAFRDVKGRKTIQVELAGKSYFLKQHFGVGWQEVVKNLLSFKKPILGAMTEVHAIEKLEELGIATTPLVAYGQRGSNPAKLQSFVLTQDLGDITSLEDLSADWKNNPPDAEFKRRLVIALAQLAARLHGAGLCHRDFYLCHFVLKKAELARGDGDIALILIDLHRMLVGQSSSGRAVMKDIAGLYFSTMDYGFNADDWALFKQYYLPQTNDFWTKVEVRANQLYAKFHSEKFQKRLSAEKAIID
jgi:UDP-glucose:(heptosyl)LPS alpha-1,3-glucosyltransferase/heptose I phosphotransferase